MYYSTFQKSVLDHRLTAFFIISIFLITFPAKSFAEVFDETAQEYHQKAYEAHQKGNLEQALSYYSKAMEFGVQNPVVFNDMGVLYEQLGAGDRAADYYLEAIRIDPNYLPAYTNLGYYYLEQGDTARAGKYFRKRLIKAPENDPWRDTIEQELINADPSYKEEQVAKAAKKLNKELIDKARERFNLQIIRSEKHYQQGQSYMAEKKFKEATLEFTRALALTPNNPKIVRAREQSAFHAHVDDIRRRTNSAIEKLEAKDVKSARKQFEDILTHFPNE